MKVKSTNRRNSKAGENGAKSKKKYKGQGKSAPSWLPEPINEDFYSCKDFDSLVSFEVLTDYNLDHYNDPKDNENGQDNSDVSERPKRKRTAAVQNIEEEIVDQSAVSSKKVKHGTGNTFTKANIVKNSDKGQNDSIDSTTEWEVIDESDDDHSNTAPDDQLSEIPDRKHSLNKREKIKKKKKQMKKVLAPVNKISGNFSIEEWAKLGVPDAILKALEENGFDNPTSIQKQTLPASILGRKDCVGAAETGSGKTLAFVIPIINGILRERNETAEEDDYESNLKALILTPTRELAVQIKKHIDAVSTYADINAVVIVGGLAAQKQERLLRGKPDIVIATPGRLWELVENGNKYLSTLQKLKYLAIDETDRMVEKGHFQELQGILEVLNRDEEVKTSRQNFVFSATLAFTHEPPQRLKLSKGKKKKKLPQKLSSQSKLNDIMEMIGMSEDAKIVDITTGKGTCETLVEMAITCSLSQKDYYMYYFFLKHPGRTIVFCNSINCVRRLVNLFFLLQCEPLALHSEMHQKQRLRNLERFAENDKGILIATDVAARGLDIINIEHVIHYQVPKTAESYIHRSGRTARAFKGGLALCLIEPAEITTFRNISRSLGRDEMLPSFQIDGTLFNEIKARVDLGIKVEKFEHMVRKKCADTNWIEKAKKEMDLASSDEDSDRDIDGKRENKKNILQAKQQLEKAKAQLATLIAVNYSIVRRSIIKNQTIPGQNNS